MGRALVSVVLALSCWGCVRFGYQSGGDRGATSSDTSGSPERGAAVDRASEAARPSEARAHDARGSADAVKPKPDAVKPKPDAAKPKPDAAKPDAAKPDAPLTTVVPVTAANDTCASPATADFSLLQTGTLTMQISTVGAARDHAPTILCGGKVDLVVRIRNNPGDVMVQCSGASGDFVLIGPMTAANACPPTGWAQTTNCIGYSLNLLPAGDSNILICANAGQSFTITWSKL